MTPQKARNVLGDGLNRLQSDVKRRYSSLKRKRVTLWLCRLREKLFEDARLTGTSAASCQGATTALRTAVIAEHSPAVLLRMQLGRRHELCFTAFSHEEHFMSGCYPIREAGCYTWVDDDEIVKRGCYSDFSADERTQCLNDEERCQRCIEANCNNEPKGSGLILEINLMLVLFMFITSTYLF